MGRRLRLAAHFGGSSRTGNTCNPASVAALTMRSYCVQAYRFGCGSACAQLKSSRTACTPVSCASRGVPHTEPNHRTVSRSRSSPITSGGSRLVPAGRRRGAVRRWHRAASRSKRAFPTCAAPAPTGRSLEPPPRRTTINTISSTTPSAPSATLAVRCSRRPGGIELPFTPAQPAAASPTQSWQLSMGSLAGCRPPRHDSMRRASPTTDGVRRHTLPCPPAAIIARHVNCLVATAGSSIDRGGRR